MARKDLIEALQHMEKQRQSTLSSAEDAASDPSAGARSVPTPARAQDTSAMDDGDGDSSREPKLERVVETPSEPAELAHHRATRARSGFEALSQPLVLAVVALAFALGFLLGGARSNSVSASGGGAERDAVSESFAPLTPPPASSPLLDPTNRFTVVAIAYDNSAFGRELARETTEHFRAVGLEAHDPIQLRSTSRLVVVLGAAPTSESLAALRDAVRATDDASGNSGQFAEAYICEISSLID